ncbi:MAG: ornithine cyclodeaminase family protein [Cytophagales bacterium]|nr:ornithine cyclodeaminase family protein [Cytophagales bacterium]
MKVVTVNGEQVAAHLSMGKCIDLMANALKTLAEDASIQPLRSIMWLPGKKGLLGMMPAFEGDTRIMGIKVISVFPENQKAGLSSHQGVILLFDSKNGKLLSIIDAEEVTAIRTAAVSAVATRSLANKDARNLAILGSGVQASRHLEAISLVRKIEKAKIWSRNHQHAEQLVRHESGKLNFKVEACKTVQQTVEDADIICTTTAAKEPILSGEWVKQGVHINAVGACTPSSRELDSELVVRSKLFTDRRESLFNEAGDFLIPKKEGLIKEEKIGGEIGEVLLRKVKGRESREEITIFKALGLAVEDLAAGYYVYKKSI